MSEYSLSNQPHEVDVSDEFESSCVELCAAVFLQLVDEVVVCNLHVPDLQEVHPQANRGPSSVREHYLKHLPNKIL